MVRGQNTNIFGSPKRRHGVLLYLNMYLFKNILLATGYISIFYQLIYVYDTETEINLRVTQALYGKITSIILPINGCVHIHYYIYELVNGYC